MLTSRPALVTFTSLGDLLKYLRRRARLSQRDLVIAVGYSESHLSRIEAGERPLDRTSLLALFVPALCIQDEPEILERLLAFCPERASNTGSELLPPASFHSAPHPRMLVHHRLPAQLTPLTGHHAELVTLCDLSGRRQVRLLMIGNFEHLLPAAPFIAVLLAACPYVQIMVTSQARLQLYGE